MVHIAVCFDKKYLTPFHVLATSIFKNNPGLSIHFHAVAVDLSGYDKSQIRKFLHQHQSAITYYNIRKEVLAGLVVDRNSHVTVVTYCRLLLPDLVPIGVEKLLYLDTDIVVIGSLRELFKTPLGKYPVAVVPEVTATYNRPDLEIYEPGEYFNSGVMLINIREWQLQNIGAKALRFAREFPHKIRLADQDALNVVLQNNYVALDNKYNVIHSDVPKYLSKSKITGFLHGKVIIHYTLRKSKPWNALGKSRLRFLYFKYLKQSSYASKIKYTDFSYSPSFLKRFIKVRTIETLLEYNSTSKLVKLYYRKRKKQ